MFSIFRALPTVSKALTFIAQARAAIQLIDQGLAALQHLLTHGLKGKDGDADAAQASA